MASIVLIKLVLLFLLGLIPLVFGLLPIWLIECLARLAANSTHRSYSSIAISTLSCFSGGVIFGVSLLELLPEAREELEKVHGIYPIFDAYPFIELMVGLGFLLVYLVEEFTTLLFGHHHHSHGATPTPPMGPHPPAGEKKANYPPKCWPQVTATGSTNNLAPSPTNISACDSAKPPPGNRDDPELSACSCSELVCKPATISDEASIREEEQERATVGAISLVLAMMIHTSLEGFAFGVQRELVEVGSLFFGIGVHKALVFFSVGMNLMRALPHNRRMVVLLIALLASFTPIGGLIGMALEDSNIQSTTKSVVSAVLTAISIGTFLYIATFEILAQERQNQRKKRLLQWSGCASGFLLMAAVISFMGHADHHHSDTAGEK